MKKGLVRITKVTLFILLCLASILFLTTITNIIITRSERDSFRPPGEIVDVTGKKIHVYSQGTETKNVVLLSGLGTLSPELDFRALATELKSSFKVTILEYPGYGWSSDTEELRSTSNSVEEIRAALSTAHVLPPYILVAHSFSGLQSLLYVNKYPKEISGIVGLDISVPEQVNFSAWRRETINWYEILRVTGIARILLLVDPTIAVGHKDGVTAEEIADYNRIVNWVAGSRAIFGEANEFATNLRALKGLKFPASVPTTLVIASENANQKNPGLPGETWVRIHRDILEDKLTSRLVILKGDHYIHHQNTKEIAALVRDIAKGNQ